LGEEKIMVPSLLGLTLAEAKIVIEQNGIILGAIVVDPGVTDTLAAFIYEQNPPRYNEDKEPLFIQSGQLMGPQGFQRNESSKRYCCNCIT
jgi:hypothetical protein